MAQLRACEVRQLLHNKFVVVMGDSVQLAVYKDLVLLLQKDCLLSSSQLKAKGELSFERDMLLVGCSSGRMHYGSHYREVRQFRSGHHLVRFYFLTRVYSHYAERVVEELRRSEPAPDVVVMNSCLWDLARDGRGFPRSYRRDVESLFARLDWALPTSCLLLWNTAMPVADTISGSCLPCARHLRRAHLREDVMEANFYSSAEAERRGFDVLDLHFHFRHAARHRLPDGVHWDERAHRHLSQLLLAHLADAWGVDLPRREAVDGWVRHGHANRRAAPAGRRRPRDDRADPHGRGDRAGRGDLRSPRPPTSFFPWARPPFPPRRQVAYLPSYRHFSSDSSTRHIRHRSEENARVGRGSRPGPIRTSSALHRERGHSPYRPWRPSEPRLSQRSRTRTHRGVPRTPRLQ
ncbi:PREDICTED: PC-esterase domain-containing protein 1B-like [Cercocebus atys]|uniref:PC-esterase domain-containing protein 1B-like n=1 Tax=Cercocebus atys TaxID=9531 RepID=UPI0005F3CCFE|nr:PREDICTED: PC-esterase domain-containing protein 1B-like [Cercocebus atys]